MMFQWPQNLAWLVLPIVLSVVIFWDTRYRRRLTEKFLGSWLIDRYLPEGLFKRRQFKQILNIAALAFLCVALAGPRFGKKLREVTRRGSDVIIAVDVSASMLAEDVSPNRITKAKRELSALIEKLKGERIGIIAFAGTAFLQCPLTIDSEAATMYLNLLDPTTFPVPGTDIGSAIRLALQMIPGDSHAALVLLTDGEDFGKETANAVKEAAQKGLRIFAIGFGTPQGELIRIRNESGEVTGFKKDENGQTVVSHLNESLLAEMAQGTGGRYFQASNGDLEVDELAQEISKMEKRDLGNQEIAQFEHRFQIPLWIAFICLFMEMIIPERDWFLENFQHSLNHPWPPPGLRPDRAGGLILLPKGEGNRNLFSLNKNSTSPLPPGEGDSSNKPKSQVRV